MKYTQEQISDATNHLARWGREMEKTRQDILDVMRLNPDAVTAVLSALEEGRIDGMSYYGKCACLLGTIAASKPEFRRTGIQEEWNQDDCTKTSFIQSVGDLVGRVPDESTAAENFFLNIGIGDTPATSPHCLLAHAWISDWARVEGLLERRE